MIVCVPTVRHSGTQFVVDYLLKEFKNVPPSRPWEEFEENFEAGRDIVVRHHFGQKHFERFKEIIEVYDPWTITPLRRLDNIIRSWENRQKEITLLEKELSILVEWDREKHCFLPVDHPDRESYLDHINQSLGLSLKTDWKRIGRDMNPSPLERDQETYHRIKERFQPFFDRFYGFS